MKKSKKQILFKLYEKIFSENIGEMDCGSCSWCEENEESVVLFPFEEEFISRKLGKKLRTYPIICMSGTLKSLNKPTIHCKFFHRNKCTIYSIRPISCRIYPFNPNLDEKGRLNLYIDMTCPKSREILKDKRFLRKMINICRELAEIIDVNFWKAWSSMPVELDNERRKQRFVCFLKQF